MTVIDFPAAPSPCVTCGAKANEPCIDRVNKKLRLVMHDGRDLL